MEEIGKILDLCVKEVTVGFKNSSRQVRGSKYLICLEEGVIEFRRVRSEESIC